MIEVARQKEKTQLWRPLDLMSSRWSSFQSQLHREKFGRYPAVSRVFGQRCRHLDSRLWSYSKNIRDPIRESVRNGSKVGKASVDIIGGFFASMIIHIVSRISTKRPTPFAKAHTRERSADICQQERVICARQRVASVHFE